jgi:hypothetical protein
MNWEGKPVFDGMTERTDEMLRVDQEADGIPYETASGVTDFHALRAAYITHLISSGASVKTYQTLDERNYPGALGDDREGRGICRPTSIRGGSNDCWRLYRDPHG